MNKMVSYTLDELKVKGIRELKRIARDLGLETKGYTSANKVDLARKIRGAAKSGKAKARSPRKASRRRRTPRKTPKARGAAKAPPEEDLSGMTRAQLVDVAKERGIKGYSKLKKDDLREYIESQMGAGVPTKAKVRAKAKKAAKAALADLSKMTAVQLKEFARESGIDMTGKSKLRKAELLAYIEGELTGVPAPGGMPAPAPPKPKVSKAAVCGEVSDCRKTSTKLDEIRAVAEACGLDVRAADGRLKNRATICRELETHLESLKGEEVEVEDEFFTEEPVAPKKKGKKKKEVEVEVEDEFFTEEPVAPKKKKKAKVKVVEEEGEDTIPFEWPEEEESEIEKLRKQIEEEGIILPPDLSEEELRSEYLEAERCDPGEGDLCSEEGYVCDVRPLPGHKGICIPPSRSPAGLSEFTYKGKKIVGSSAAIAALRAKLSPKKALPVPPKKLPVPPKKPSPPKKLPAPPKAAAKIPREDIAEILKEVKETEEPGDLGEIENAVFKCLGLTS